MFRPFAASFCCFLFLVSLPGEFAEKKNECTENKLLEAIECFIRPIVNNIPEIELDEHLNPAGRKLQSILENSIKDVRKKIFYMDKIGNDLKEIGANLRNLIVKSRTKKLQKAEALKMIRNFDKEKGLRIFINHLHSTFMPIANYINFLKRNQNHDQDIKTLLYNEAEQKSSRNIYKLIEMFNCLSNINDYEKFEDGVEFMECFYDCDSLPTIGTCLQDTFSNCTDDAFQTIRNIIMRVFVDAMRDKLKNCYFRLNPDPEYGIILNEGDEGRHIKFSLLAPPFLYCTKLDNLTPSIIEIIADFILGEEEKCNVQVEMSNKNYLNELLPDIDIFGLDIFKNPKCKDGTAINQFSIGCDSCNITIDEDNWMNEWTVILKASIDRQKDGDFSGRFGLKLWVNDQHEASKSLTVNVTDKDSDTPKICRVLTNSHIITFDGSFYNNFHHGYFVLYQTNDTNYEVQTVHQRCENNASCICAVFVRSMNDVMSFDMCRRKGTTKPKSIQFSTFVSGNLTIGTKVYSRDKGMRYEVVLPSGTTVKIAQHNFFLHVYIMGTPADYENTKGLCGFYNNDKDDDLMLRNGTIFSGEGSNRGEQPKEFNLDWRVPNGDKLYDGFHKVENRTTIGFCRCSHVLLLGVEGSCDHGAAETCNILGDDISHHLPVVTRHSKNDSVSDNYDIDEELDPKDLPLLNGTDPTKECKDLIIHIPLIKDTDCNDPVFPIFEFEDEIEICVQDIKLTQNITEWGPFAVEGAKELCLSQVFWERRSLNENYDRYLNKSCLNECYNQGICKSDGSCECSTEASGGDCSLKKGSGPLEVTRILRNGLCDTRKENCSSIVVFGNNIMIRQEIKCNLEEIKIKGKDVKLTGKKHTVDAHPISNSQFYCSVPKIGSYKVYFPSPKHHGELRMKRSVSSFLTDYFFVSHDTACFSCKIQDNRVECNRRPEDDHCVINDNCFMNLEKNPGDDCKICNATLSTSAWSYENVKQCKDIERAEMRKKKDDEKLKKIRIGVSVSLSVIIIIVAVSLYILIGRHEKPIENDSEFSDDMHIKEFKPGNGSATYENEAFDDDRKMPFELLKRGERERAMSSSSIGSVGIGGAGPTTFSKPTFTHMYDARPYRSRENSQSGTLPRRNQVGGQQTESANHTQNAKKKDDSHNLSTQL